MRRPIDPVWLDKKMLDKSTDLLTTFCRHLCQRPDFFEDDADEILAFAPESDPEFAAADLQRALDQAREKGWGVEVIHVAGDGRPGPRFSIARRIPPEEVARLADEELPVAA